MVGSISFLSMRSCRFEVPFTLVAWSFLAEGAVAFFFVGLCKVNDFRICILESLFKLVDFVNGLFFGVDDLFPFGFFEEFFGLVSFFNFCLKFLVTWGFFAGLLRF